MKAKLDGMGQFVLTLIPESGEDREALRDLSEKTARVHIINCRGIRYLEQDVEFLIQPMPRGD